MRARDGDAEHADDGDDCRSASGFHERVAPETRRICSVTARQARRERESIDRGEREHRREQRELDEKQLAVSGADQCWNVADEVPGVDESRDEQESHAQDAQRREASRHRSANVGLRDITQQNDEPGQRTQPGAGREEMQRVGSELNCALRAGCGMSRPCERSEIRAGGRECRDTRSAKTLARWFPNAPPQRGEQSDQHKPDKP